MLHFLIFLSFLTFFKNEQKHILGQKFFFNILTHFEVVVVAAVGIGQASAEL